MTLMINIGIPIVQMVGDRATEINLYSETIVPRMKFSALIKTVNNVAYTLCYVYHI